MKDEDGRVYFILFKVPYFQESLWYLLEPSEQAEALTVLVLDLHFKDLCVTTALDRNNVYFHNKGLPADHYKRSLN